MYMQPLEVNCQEVPRCPCGKEYDKMVMLEKHLLIWCSKCDKNINLSKMHALTTQTKKETHDELY